MHTRQRLFFLLCLFTWVFIVSALPKYLYHGAVTSSDQLRPATKSDDYDDGDEEPAEPSYLFVSAAEKLAIEKGIEAAIRKTHQLKSIQFLDKEIKIELDVRSPPFTHAMFDRLKFTLYTIIPKSSDGWVPVEQHPSCWKTSKAISSICSKQPLTVGRLMATRKVKIIHPRFP